MKITGIRTIRLDVPMETPVATSIHQIRSIGYVLVLVDTDAEVTGEGYLFSISARHLEPMEAMVAGLGNSLIGEDGHAVEGLWHKLWREINFFGAKGISVFALSALDMALWDARGKALGQPIHRLLGSCRDTVPAYASGGLWLSASADELVAEAKEFRQQGFRAMKMRVGSPRWRDDAARVEAVRDAIGPDCMLMVDANQGLTTDRALRLGRALEGFDLGWFEEPVPAYDVAGHAALAAALDTPIATGESEYARYGFRPLIEAKAADVLMPDLGRVGGVTEFVRVAHMAQAWDLPVSPHIFPEHSLQLCGAIGNCDLLEHMPWFRPLFRERLELRNGRAVVPDRPGFGFTFDLEGLEKYRTGSAAPKTAGRRTRRRAPAATPEQAPAPAPEVKPEPEAVPARAEANAAVPAPEPAVPPKAPPRKPKSRTEGRTPWYRRGTAAD